MFSRRDVVVGLALVAVLVGLYVGALAVAPSGAEFVGTDAAAGEMTGGVPWLEPLFRPGSAELESGLFALQAGLGGVLLGFVLGRFTARSES